MTERLPAGLVRRVALVVGLVCCVMVVGLGVEGLALAAGGRAGTWDWLGGAVVLAVLVPLVRPALDGLADRAAYGRQGDPYAVLATFVQRISDTLAVDDVLPQLAMTAVQATHSASGGVRLWLADGQERHETWPPGAPAAAPGEVTLVLEHGGEQVGSLEVGGADDELRDVDRELLNRLAGPAGLALSNVRLTLELRRRLAQTMALSQSVRRSRERLLETGHDQRESFVSAVRGRVLTPLDAVERRLLATTDVVASLRVAERDALACLEALRDLAAGVFPPALVDRGVGAALDWQLDRTAQPVMVHDEVGADVRYPPAVESAAYFCCVAIADDLAAGARLTIDLSGDDAQLRFEARGTAPVSSAVEQLVQDRVAALGGDVTVSHEGAGSVVLGRIPVGGASLTAVLAQLGGAWSDRPSGADVA